MRGVVHEDQLDAGIRDLLVGGGGCDRVGRDGDDDVGILAHHGLKVGDLLVRLEIGIGYRDHLDAKVRELGLETGDLRGGPVVAAVVHHDRGSGSQRLDLIHLFVGEIGCAGRCGVLAVRALAENLPFQFAQRGVDLRVDAVRRGWLGGSGIRRASCQPQCDDCGDRHRTDQFQHGVLLCATYASGRQT